MKPIRLSLQAFGPFAECQEVDFTKLPSDSLFLIHGPTGAGKTSILDGICYALYGETSGSERLAKEMRSHHAADSTLTEIEFEFDVGGKRYRVKRSPEQERTALRGKKGLVSVAATAELHVRTEGSPDTPPVWEPIVSKATEVTASIVRLLGFEADQFRQVIMLPQGKFRELLTADSKNREKILEALFATEIYKRLQDRLSTSARELETQAKAADARRKTLLEQADAESEDAIASRIRGAATQLASQTELEQKKRVEETAAAAAVLAGEALATQFTELLAARGSLETLQSEKATIELGETQVALAERAQRVVPAYEAVTEAARQRQAVINDLAGARKSLTEASSTLASAQKNLAAESQREPERQKAVGEITRLEGLRETVQKLKQAEAERTLLQATAGSAEKQLAATLKLFETETARRVELQKETERLTPLANRGEALALTIEQQEKLLHTVQNANKAELAARSSQHEETKLGVTLETARIKLGNAKSLRDALEVTWRSAQAAVLARHLVDGGPCPVCGSENHPSLAEYEGELPTESELETASNAVRTAESEFESVRTGHQAANTKHSVEAAAFNALKTQLPEDCPGAESIQTTVGNLKTQKSESEKAVAQLVKIAADVQKIEQSLANRAASLEKQRNELDEAKLKLATVASQCDERRAAVPATLRADGDLDQAIKAARNETDALIAKLKLAQEWQHAASTAEAGALGRHKTLLEAATSAETRHAIASTKLTVTLKENDFVDESTFQASIIVIEALELLRGKIKRYRESLSAAATRLTRAESAVSGKAPPDLVALKAALQSIREVVEGLLAQNKVLGERIEIDRRTHEMLDVIRQEQNLVEDRYRILGNLAKIANGENGKRLTFQRYVLAALLDDVLRQASLRLKSMSRGRYTLQRREDVSDGRRAGGLDLEVFDDNTGRPRPANTLSGGEGFMAALSLALGLSDVVQSFAGGVQLDTLFIDEGFGSLDQESLDMAMKALIDLQQKGRMVGIISHVDELKRQIGVGIEVTLGAAGSHVRVGQNY